MPEKKAEKKYFLNVPSPKLPALGWLMFTGKVNQVASPRGLFCLETSHLNDAP